MQQPFSYSADSQGLFETEKNIKYTNVHLGTQESKYSKADFLDEEVIVEEQKSSFSGQYREEFAL